MSSDSSIFVQADATAAAAEKASTYINMRQRLTPFSQCAVHPKETSGRTELGLFDGYCRRL